MRLLSTISGFAFLTACFLIGCGSASNNDQGLSVTFLGYKANADDCDPPDETSSTGTTEPFSTTTENGTLAGGIIAGFVVQNNLTSQHIILQNALLEFFVPGATAQPPSSSSPLGFVIGAAQTEQGDAGAEDTITPEFGCGETFIVPAEVRNWMLLNRNSLPEPPFTMEVRAFVSLMTASGDRLETNEVKYAVQFTPDIIIDAGGGAADGGGDDGTDDGTTDDGTDDTGGTDDSGTGDGSGTDGTGEGDGGL